jgi:hypothetical protein
MTQQTATNPPPETSGRHPNPVKIGLWGAPQSGKTTYLAALTIAAGQANASSGSWNIYPRSTASQILKEEFERVLMDNRQFPNATVPGTRHQLEWEFVGDLARSKFDRRRLRRGPLESRFMLDLIDVHGDAYRRVPAKAAVPDQATPDRAVVPDQATAKAEVAAAAFDHLAQSQGIIYLFDPIGEQAARNSAAYVRATLNELLRRAATNGHRPGRYLQQQLSVCITKFDDQDLFDQAREMHLVSKGGNGMPEVRDEHAEQFFDELCSGKFWNTTHYARGQESAQYVRERIHQHFAPDRIRYFVTSSIGFWMMSPNGDKAGAWFDPDDPFNYTKRRKKVIIRGKVRPVNVLEPLISLQRRIAGG